MADRDFQIFLSAVTSEFGAARDALAADLRARETLVRVQSDFRQESEANTTLKKLHDYICDCSAVVAIIGKRSGDYPPPAASAPFNHMLPPGIAKASYTQWEFFFARHYKRRLSIYIANDEYVPDRLEVGESDDPRLQQSFVAHIVKEEGVDRDYFSSEDRLCRLVLKEDWPAKRRSNLPDIQVEIDRLPFLADRQPQIWRICTSITRRMDSAPSSARELQPVTPSLFILPSWEEDAVDMFHWRLTDKDGPEYCEFSASRDSPNWVGKRLTWPTTSTPDTFQREFITANLPYVRTALRTARQRRRPVCFRTLVAVSEIERDFRRFVDAWVGSWPPILQQAAETPRGESQQSTAPPPIVGLLVFQYRSSTSRGWSFWKRRDVRIDRLCDLLKDVDRSAAVEVTVLPPLTTVTFQNAGEWLESPDVLGHNLDRRVRGAIQQMFQNRRAGVPMEEFASTINAAQEYRERGHAQ